MKYIVTKADGSPVDPKARYFVLRVDHHGTIEETAAARAVVGAYARIVRSHNPEIADAAEKVLDETKNANGF